MVNDKAVASSIKGYLFDIFFLQYLHFPWSTRYENKGTLSNHLIVFLHFGQFDLPFKIDSPTITLWVNAVKKEPMQRPITNITKNEKMVIGSTIIKYSN